MERGVRWERGRLIFVNSMSDLFHERIPADYIRRVMAVIRSAPQHQFQILTKRVERLAEYARVHKLPPNAWVGASVENSAYTWRIDLLREVPARVRFLSIEPLLGTVGNLELAEIHWVIVGGESGHHARPMAPAWVREIREQCLAAGVPFFFKQWEGKRKARTGRVLDGRTWDEMPRGVAIP